MLVALHISSSSPTINKVRYRYSLTPYISIDKGFIYIRHAGAMTLCSVFLCLVIRRRKDRVSTKKEQPLEELLFVFYLSTDNRQPTTAFLVAVSFWFVRTGFLNTNVRSLFVVQFVQLYTNFLQV